MYRTLLSSPKCKQQLSCWLQLIPGIFSAINFPSVSSMTVLVFSLWELPSHPPRTTPGFILPRQTLVKYDPDTARIITLDERNMLRWSCCVWFNVRCFYSFWIKHPHCLFLLCGEVLNLRLIVAKTCKKRQTMWVLIFFFSFFFTNIQLQIYISNMVEVILP